MAGMMCFGWLTAWLASWLGWWPGRLVLHMSRSLHAFALSELLVTGLSR